MYLQISNFKPGLDLRRSELTSVPGTLETLNNAHINQGGEIEKRLAFVLNTAALTTSSFGLLAAPNGIYVFGSVSSGTIGTLPSPFLYQQLVHPNGAAMTGVVSATLYGSFPFVIASFNSGDTLCYYNGVLVQDFVAGEVLSYQNTDVAVATEIALLTNQSGSYTAIQNQGVTAAAVNTQGASYSVNDILTVIGGVGTAATLKVTSVNIGAVVAVSIQSAGSYSTLPSNPVSVTGGTGTGAKFNLTLGLLAVVNIYSTLGQSFNSSVTLGSSNAGSGAIGVSAISNGTAGIAGNNATGQFVITNGDTTGTVTVVSVNGVSILNATVAWATSNANTATLVAASINAKSGSAYTAVATANTVVISAIAQATTQNGYVVSVTCTGALVIGNCAFALAFTSSFNQTSVPKGTYTQNFITDANGLSLLGASYANPDTTNGTGSAPNLAWSSLSNIYQDLVNLINNYSTGLYLAYSDNVTGIWISKRVTTSSDAAISINVALGSYFTEGVVNGATGNLSVSVNPASISLIQQLFKGFPTPVQVTASTLYGAPPYTITWQIVSKTVTNLYMTNSSGTYSPNTITGNQVTFGLTKASVIGTNSDPQAVLVTVTDSNSAQATCYLAVTASTP